MNIKKFFKFSILLFTFLILANSTLVCASNIDMNLSNTSDDTVYGSSATANNTSNNGTQNNSNPTSISVGSSSALSSSDLGTQTVINIILIVIGILLILLGIAILIRMR